jgi:hypothetical protein
MSKSKRHRPRQNKPAAEKKNTESQPQTGAKKSEPQNNGCVDVINAGRAAGQHNEAEEHYWKRQIFWQATTAIAAILAFIAAAVYAYFADQQVTAMQNTLGQTRIAASAAATQATVADEAMRVSNRPYLEIENRIDDPTGPRTEWSQYANGERSLKIWFFNWGNTPASRVRVNAGPDPAQFLHLSLKPVERSVTWQGKVAFLSPGPGEAVSTDNVTHKALGWIKGDIISAHSDLPVTAWGFGENERAQIDSGQSIKVSGDFEYMNVFGEYCCRPFELEWTPKTQRFAYTPTPLPETVYCPADLKNICASGPQFNIPVGAKPAPMIIEPHR